MFRFFLIVVLVAFVLLWWFRRGKSARTRERWIPVRPKNYRRIAIYAIENTVNPVVLMNRRRVNDFTESGPLTQKGIRTCQGFEIRDGAAPILGFHANPAELAT